ncbi:MAG: metalloregulator ArsR/SmtB family transcription factor [Erythrobacteraceae bacterium]|jgi:DNA-binding transcriptional ArsR family regulator|nr:metalloregulator ArsR/SmtB family transcription factor [Erythrobacteraceae bacterium]
MITEDDLIEALKALAHPLRFRILTALAAGERNVGEIEQVTGIGQPGLSQQLGVLRKAGLVDTRKEAKLVFYSIATRQIAEVTAALAALSPGMAITPEEPAALRTPAPGVANFARMS